MTRTIATKFQLGMPIIVALLWSVFAAWGIDWR